MNKLFHIVVFLLSVTFLAGCKNDRPESPGAFAVKYYNHLLNGEYDEYIAGMAHSDSMTVTYKNQFKELLAQYMHAEKERGGIVGVSLLSDTVINDRAQVFLELQYGDSLREEIAVPMILINQEWRLQ